MSNETVTRTAMGGADPRAAAVTSDTPGHFALQGELGAAKARIITAADHARRLLERDLHDGLQQRLLCLQLKVRLAEASLPDGYHELSCELADIAEGLTEALENIREISRGLHPAILTQCGLAPAVKALVRGLPVPVRLHADVDGRLPDAVETGAYYIISEALANAAKHAHATVVDVSIKKHRQSLDLTVWDNGVGGADTSGSGLTGLADRVDALAGRMQFRSPPGRGTHLFITFPLK